MGGKTGTAQVRRISKEERETGVKRNEDLPWKDRDHSLFVGYAPVDDPRYVVSRRDPAWRQRLEGRRADRPGPPCARRSSAIRRASEVARNLAAPGRSPLTDRPSCRERRTMFMRLAIQDGQSQSLLGKAPGDALGIAADRLDGGVTWDSRCSIRRQRQLPSRVRRAAGDPVFGVGMADPADRSL